MKRIEKVEYLYENHGDFDREWLAHKNISEWWYITGVLYTEDKQCYSYQYTFIRPYIFSFQPNVLMLALSNLQTGEHHYLQYPKLFPGGIEINADHIRFCDKALLTKDKEGMKLVLNTERFQLELDLGYGKGSFWHCDNGILQMGVNGREQQTTYYSYTNMPSQGKLTVNGKTMTVTGKSWFDKQGGPFTLTDNATHWQWFSLRFHDDEEMMLFTFPQTGNYKDGTFINAKGESQRLQNYDLRDTEYLTKDGMKFSCAWELDTPGFKEEHYTINPLMPGQINMAYYEQLAGIYNRDGKEVGLCFVELLPGVWNQKPTKIGPLLRKVEI